MDPHLPFLRAIAANPADDLPRLVYADFLEETDEPIHVARAHFIRTQIALESLTPRSREHREAKALERRLTEMFEYQWRFDLPDYLRQEGLVTWRRGFPDSARMTTDRLFDHGRELFAIQPIARLHLDDGLGQHRLGRVDFLVRLTALKLGPWFHPIMPAEGMDETDFFADLMTLPVLPGLKQLDLSGNHLADAWLVRFVSAFPGASFAASLEELDLSHCHTVTDAGANTLATTRSLDRLKVLRLVGVPLSDAAVVMLRRRFGERLVV